MLVFCQVLNSLFSWGAIRERKFLTIETSLHAFWISQRNKYFLTIKISACWRQQKKTQFPPKHAHVWVKQWTTVHENLFHLQGNLFCHPFLSFFTSLSSCLNTHMYENSLHWIWFHSGLCIHLLILLFMLFQSKICQPVSHRWMPVSHPPFELCCRL